MKKFLIGLAVTLGVIGFGVFIFASAIATNYNNFITLRNSSSTQWSQVEAQYQRRFDLVPNLAEATKGYLIHEQEVFQAIAYARARYGSALGDAQKMENIKIVDRNLAKILVAIENYPNLKANETVKGLMDELAGTENRINVARQRYNEAVFEYNTTIQRFPANFIANFFQFKEKPLFENEEGANKAVHIDMNTRRK